MRVGVLLLMSVLPAMHARGTVTFRTGEVGLPPDHWFFEMDEWVDWPGGFGAYCESPDCQFEPGLELFVVSGQFQVVEIPPEGRGTSLLGNPGTNYGLGAITVIEYPATTIGIDLVGDPTGWTAELWGVDGTGFALLESRPLEGSGQLEWSVVNGYVSSLRLSNGSGGVLDPLVIDSLYVGDFLGDPVPEGSSVAMVIFGSGLLMRRRCRQKR